MTEKEKIQAAFQEFIADNNTRLKDSVNGMMKAEYVDGDPQTSSVTLRFPVLPWKGIGPDCYMEESSLLCWIMSVI